VTWTIAGLRVEILPAPSDASDSLTIWFPDLGVAVQNLVWPTLFNIFAIRGEEYRDPRVLLSGLDDLRRLGADHVLSTHGPVLHGKTESAARMERYRDSIQFLWDQTVRGMNRGWTADDIAERVRLPSLYDQDFITSERYGVAEHHVRQIYTGLKGWFDGDTSKLFPLPPVERASRLIDGFGGHENVRAQVRHALGADDLRWALELATWLVRSPASDDMQAKADRNLLATCLRDVAQRSPAANIRNWALAQARDLDGTSPMDRLRTHRFRRDAIIAAPSRTLDVLRVMLDPHRAEGVNHHLRIDFGDGAACGLHVRNAVACPTDGSGAQSVLKLAPAAWADLMLGKETLPGLLASGSATVDGDAKAVAAVLSCFDFTPAAR
jgi:alkyl sulfatase BDS1-like metallo-beta-lactamase superfamily hydrolase